MTLTHEQRLALDRGEAAETTVSAWDCVVLTKAVYDRVSKRKYDAGALTRAEEDIAFREAGLIAGWDDPEMSIYDELGD